MKLKHFVTLATITVFGLSANTASASSQNDAYNACKSHVSELHDGQANIKLKKIRKKKGNIEVKVKVNTNGDRFTALCIVARDGTLTYSNGNEIVAKN
ncbi:MAG: hypothetical protein JKY88_08115 [Pseudomonadales bacterium]|nr:hypothetical protein [Pseudomonadales bacterium]